MTRTRCLPLLLLAALAGCDDATDDLEAACVEADLIAQCPAATSPIVGARGEASCSAAVGGIVSDGTGAATGQCHGAAGCRVFCQFAVPCRCGVAEVTAEGVLCAPCEGAAACGNGACEGGEDPVSCPADCGAACEADERRCAGVDQEICSQQGRWERVACPDGEACEVGEAGAECVRMIDIVTGDMGPDDGVDGGPIDDSRVIPGPAPWPDVPDTRVDPLPAPLAVHLDITLEGAPGATGGSVQRWTAGAGDTVVGFGSAGWARLDAAGAVQATAAYGLPEADFRVTLVAAQRGGLVFDTGRSRTRLGLFDLRTLQVEPLGPVADYQVAERRSGAFRQLWDPATTISPDGRAVAWIATQNRDSAILVWHRGAGAPQPLFPRSGPQVLSIALAPGARVLASHVYGSPDPAVDDAIALWDTEDERRILSIRGLPDIDSVARRVMLSPSGRDLAVHYLPFGGAAPWIEIWDLASAEKRHTLALPEGADATAWDWAPDGRLLAIHAQIRQPNGTVERGEVTLFDTESGQRIVTHPLLGQSTSVAFSADGRLTVHVSTPRPRTVVYGPPRD